MPILPVHKKAVGMIISNMKRPNDYTQMLGDESKGFGSDESKEDYEPGLEAACDDIIAAISTKNSKLLMQAMKDFHSMYDEQREGEEPGEEKMEERNE